MMIVLAGTAYRLVPTFKALLQLEQRTGTGLITLARRFAEGSFTLQDALEVLRAGSEGAGETLPDNAGELLVRQGVVSVAQPLCAFLQCALAGDDDAGKA